MKSNIRFFLILFFVASATSSCSFSGAPKPTEKPGGTSSPTPEVFSRAIQSPTASPAPTATDPIEDARRTLASLKKVGDYPLYTMTYYSDYSYNSGLTVPKLTEKITASNLAWGCSLFAAIGEPGNKLYGRNFDWEFSPALLLFTHPPDGYASVSMVDLAYIIDVRDYNRLTDLALEDRKALLEAAWLPFDGMNAEGVAIGMAAVPAGNKIPDPGKETIGSILVIREVLDHARNVDEAVAIFQKYNIDWGNGPGMHYLIADSSGRAVLIEYSGEKMVTIRNQDPWHLATNFLVDQAGENPEGNCWRYKRISQRLTEQQGKLTLQESMSLLSEVAQTNSYSNTQWSVVYDINTGELRVVMGQQFDKVFSFSLDNLR